MADSTGRFIVVKLPVRYHTGAGLDCPGNHKRQDSLLCCCSTFSLGQSYSFYPRSALKALSTIIHSLSNERLTHPSPGVSTFNALPCRAVGGKKSQKTISKDVLHPIPSKI